MKHVGLAMVDERSCSMSRIIINSGYCLLVETSVSNLITKLHMRHSVNQWYLLYNAAIKKSNYNNIAKNITRSCRRYLRNYSFWFDKICPGKCTHNYEQFFMVSFNRTKSWLSEYELTLPISPDINRSMWPLISSSRIEHWRLSSNNVRWVVGCEGKIIYYPNSTFEFMFKYISEDNVVFRTSHADNDVARINCV